MRKRYIVLVLGLATLAWQVESGREQTRNRELAGQVGSAVRRPGAPLPLAGTSALGRVEVRRLSRRTLGSDVGSPEYHRYLNRCGTCHSAPAPDLHSAAEWRQVIDRMHANMGAAGTLGLQLDDRAAIARFLARHARR